MDGLVDVPRTNDRRTGAGRTGRDQHRPRAGGAGGAAFALEVGGPVLPYRRR